MEKQYKELQLRVDDVQLKWLVGVALERGFFDSILGAYTDDKQIQEVLQNIAMYDISASLACMAVERITDKRALEEVCVRSLIIHAKEAAGRRLKEVT